MLSTPDARIFKIQDELMMETMDMVQKEGCDPFEMAIMLTSTAEAHLMLNNEDIEDKIQWLDYVINQYKSMRKALKEVKKQIKEN